MFYCWVSLFLGFTVEQKPEGICQKKGKKIELLDFSFVHGCENRPTLLTNNPSYLIREVKFLEQKTNKIAYYTLRLNPRMI